MYDKNTLNSFTNLFPQNLDLKNREWEIAENFILHGFDFLPGALALLVSKRTLSIGYFLIALVSHQQRKSLGKVFFPLVG